MSTELWSSAYHRTSDDSVSSYGGHPTEVAARVEALTNTTDFDIDHVWVRDPTGEVIWDWQARSEEHIMNFTVEVAEYHRNGSGGAPFYVGIAACDVYDDGELQRMLITFFPEWRDGHPCPAGKSSTGEHANGRVAVISLDRLAEYGVQFGPNSWRGDNFYEVADAIVKEASA